MNELLDASMASGTLEVIGDLALPLPVRVITEMNEWVTLGINDAAGPYPLGRTGVGTAISDSTSIFGALL